MVRHEAVAPALHLGVAAIFGRQLQVAHVIGVAEERRLAAVAALGDVMRRPRFRPRTPTSYATAVEFETVLTSHIRQEIRRSVVRAGG